MSKMRPKLKYAMAVLGVSGVLVGGATAAAFAITPAGSSGHVATTNSSASDSVAVKKAAPVGVAVGTPTKSSSSSSSTSSGSSGSAATKPSTTQPSTTKPSSKNCPNMSSRPASGSSTSYPAGSPSSSSSSIT